MLHKITLQHFSKAQAGTCLLGLNRDLPPPLPSLFKNASDANAKASPGTGKFKPQSSFCKRCCVLPLHLQTEHYVDIKIAFFSHFLLGVFWQETIYCVGVVLVRLASVFAYVCFLYFLCFFWKMQSEQEVFTFFRTSVDHWEFFFMNHVFICCVVYRGLWSDKQAARGWSGTTSASKANAKMWPCWIKWSNYNH